MTLHGMVTTWIGRSKSHFLVAGLLLAGCTDNEIKTYRVAREERPKVTMASEGPHQHRPAMPHLHWDLPAGWEEQKPDRLRVASFLVRGDEGKLAQVAIIPLPGVSGIEQESLTMWREELGLDAATAEMVEGGEKVQLGDTTARLFDMVSDTPRAGETFKTRTLGVMGQRNNIFWFVKMIGEDALVAAQKPLFINFLKSLQFHEGSHGDMAQAEQPVSTNTERVPATSNLPQWKIPQNWQEKAPGPMVSAAYSVSSASGDAGEVTISKLAGEGGGAVANINRWRGQLGLQPASAAEIGSAVQHIEIDRKQAYLVDLKGTNVRTGKPARMLAMGVPRDGETWFYKFTGDEAVVEKEKDAFIQFVKSAY